MRFITVDENKIVVGIRLGNKIVEGEIESKTGELGQIMQLDGSFIEPDPIEQLLELTVEERLESMQDDIDYLILKYEGVI